MELAVGINFESRTIVGCSRVSRVKLPVNDTEAHVRRVQDCKLSGGRCLSQPCQIYRLSHLAVNRVLVL